MKMLRSKKSSSLKEQSPFSIESNDNNHCKNFIFQNSFKDCSYSTFTSNTNATPENLDSLISRLTIDPPYQLTLTIEELLAPSKRKSNSSKSPPPRPQNVFILFKKDLTARLKREKPSFAKKLQLSDSSKIAKSVWDTQPSEVKQFFQVLYFACVEKHKEMYPNYKYCPKRSNKQSSAPRIRSNLSSPDSVPSPQDDCSTGVTSPTDNEPNLSQDETLEIENSSQLSMFPEFNTDHFS